MVYFTESSDHYIYRFYPGCCFLYSNNKNPYSTDCDLLLVGGKEWARNRSTVQLSQTPSLQHLSLQLLSTSSSFSFGHSSTFEESEDDWICVRGDLLSSKTSFRSSVSILSSSKDLSNWCFIMIEFLWSTLRVLRLFWRMFSLINRGNPCKESNIALPNCSDISLENMEHLWSTSQYISKFVFDDNIFVPFIRIFKSLSFSSNIQGLRARV